MSYATLTVLHTALKQQSFNIKTFKLWAEGSCVGIVATWNHVSRPTLPWCFGSNLKKS